MPEFSLSQTAQIGRVGEHLLTLIQRLEIDSNTELYDQAYLQEFFVLPTSNLPHSIGVHYWLSLISNSLMSAIITKIHQIRNFSPKGARQLAADLGYFLKIIKMLSIGEGINYVENLEVIRDALSGQGDPTDAAVTSIMSKINTNSV